MILSKIKSKTMQDLLKVLSGNIVAQGIGFLTIVIISRDLGVEQYGIFSLLLAIFTISIQVSDFGISTSYVKYVSENLLKSKEIFYTTIITKIFLSLFIMFILYFLSNFLSIFFFETSKYADMIKLISFAIFFHSILSVIVANYQAKQKFKEFALINIVHNFIKFITILSISYIFILNYYLNYFLYAYFFSVVLILIFLIFKNFSNFDWNIKFNFNYFIEIYKLGFWVFLSSLLVIIMMRLDLFMLQKLGNTESVGLFSIVLTTNSIFILILSSIMNTLLPKVNDYLIKNSIKDYVDKLFSFKWYVLIFSVCMIIIAPLFINIFFGNEYANSTLAFQILALSYFFSFYASPLSLVLINKNKIYLLTIMNLIQLTLIFVLNLLLIPQYGLYGATISLSMMRIFGFIYIYIYIKRNYL